MFQGIPNPIWWCNECNDWAIGIHPHEGERKEMNWDEYQQGAQDTWNSGLQLDMQFFNAYLGLLGEAGELAEMHKKHVFHDKPMDHNKVRKELGDVLYYLTILCDLYDERLEEIAQLNHDKLAKRYPNGFELGGGIRE